MDYDIDTLEKAFYELVESFGYISTDDIPDIELYMDQVTTFMDKRLSPYARDPENDKILTKTMINNYAKSDLLIPPVRKKYGMDQMVLLLFIYYMKSFLSIGDIRTVLAPLKDLCGAAGAGRDREKKRAAKAGKPCEDSGKEARYTLREIYEEVYGNLGESMQSVVSSAAAQFEASRHSFPDADSDDKDLLQTFDLLCRMSADIYIRKLFIERMIDRIFDEKKAGRQE